MAKKTYNIYYWTDEKKKWNNRQYLGYFATIEEAVERIKNQYPNQYVRYLSINTSTEEEREGEVIGDLEERLEKINQKTESFIDEINKNIDMTSKEFGGLDNCPQEKIDIIHAMVGMLSLLTNKDYIITENGIKEK